MATKDKKDVRTSGKAQAPKGSVVNGKQVVGPDAVTTGAKSFFATMGKFQSVERNYAEFVPVSTVKEDARGRVTISGVRRTHKPDAYKQYVNEHGEILLVPIREIPERELWLYQNPAALQSVLQGIAEAAAGQGRVLDLSELPVDDEV